MASFSERRAKRLAEQEGQVDAPAIDSDLELGISHRETMPLGSSHYQAGDDPMARVQSKYVSGDDTTTVVPFGEQLGSMFRRFGQSVATGTGDVALGAALSREHTDNPELMIDRNLDWAHMTPAEQAQTAQKFEGKSEEEIRNIRIHDYTNKRDTFIKAAHNFSDAMPDIEAKRTSGVLGVLDDAMSGMSRFAPTMVVGGLTGGAMSIPMAYMQLLPGKYDEYVKAGVSEERAFASAQAASTALAMVEGLGTNIQLSKMAGAFSKKQLAQKGFSRFIDQVVSNGLTEGFEELAQGEIEVLFDVYAKNPDSTPDEMKDKVIGIWKDPKFQKEKLYEAAIGFVGGGTMGGGASLLAAASEKLHGGSQNSETIEDGVHVVTPDKTPVTDVRNGSVARGDRPSVRNMLGVQEGDADVEVTEDTPDGVALGSNLNVTPGQASDQLTTNDAIRKIASDMITDKGMKQTEAKIQGSENRIKTLKGFLNDAIDDGDHDGALQVANMIDEEANGMAQSYIKLIETANQKAADNNSALNPDDITNIQAHLAQVMTDSRSDVEAQTNAVNSQRVREQQAYIDSLDTVDGLEAELIKTSVESQRKSGDVKKVNEKVVREIKLRKTMGTSQYFDQIGMKALVNLKTDIGLQTFKDRQNQESADIQAMNNAMGNWADAQIADRAQLDTDALRLKQAQERARHIQPAAVKQPAKAEIGIRDSVQDVRDKQEKARAEFDKVNKQKIADQKAKDEATRQAAERDRVAAKAKQVEVGKRKVADLRKKLRKPIPGPTRTEELTEAKKAKATRVEEIKKQQVKYADLDAPTRKERAGKSVLSDEQFQETDVAPVAKALFRSAAMKLPDGKIYEGASHPTIMMENKAVEDYIMKTPIKEIRKDLMGFATHDGSFVDRDQASRLAGTQKLISEDFMGQVADVKNEQGQMEVGNFKKMTLEGKLGTLESKDMLEHEMRTGKYKFLFSKTMDTVKTFFVTAPGQYAQIPAVKNQYNNLKARDEAVTRFEGAQRPDPKTGKMVSSGGLKGAYMHKDNQAIINLPSIHRTASNLDQAMETVVHEHVHGLVGINFDKMDPVQKSSVEEQLNRLWESIDRNFLDKQRDNPEVHPRIRAGIRQIDSSIGELITYGMSHPEFAAWLNEMPASSSFRAKTSKIKTMWDALTDLIITKVLKMGSKHDELVSILNHNLKYGEKEVRLSQEFDASFDFGENVTPDTVVSWANELDDISQNALPVDVVADNTEAIEVLGYQPSDTTASFWVEGTGDQPGRVVMIADKIRSKEHFVKKWMHEQVAHQGLRNVFGSNKALFNRFLDQAYTLFSIKEPIALFEIAELYDIGKKNEAGIVTSYTKAEKRLMAEEMIALKAEVMKPEVKRGLIKRFTDFLKKWLPASFVGKKPVLIKDADIMSILSTARENVLTGTNKFGDMLTRAMAKRAPKEVFQGWEKLPKFMETDSKMLKRAAEVKKVAPNLQKWYSDHTETIKKAFGKDTDLFNVLLAITSPQTDVVINVQFAVDTYAYMMGQRDKPGALFPNKLKARIDNNWTSPDNMLTDLESKNFKVTEFTRALLGDPNGTVGDLWMYRLFFGDPAVYGKEAEAFSVPMAVALRQKLHDLAAQMSDKTGEQWTPREMQAALWISINAEQTGKDITQIASYMTGLNRPSGKYGGKTPLQWLQSVIPNLADGPLSDVVGMTKIPIAPVSALQKKMLLTMSKDKVTGSYPVKTDGVIRVLKPGKTNMDMVRMIDAIENDGRSLTAKNESMADWYKEIFGFQRDDNGLTMSLSPEAVKLYTDKKGKVKANLVRDNLGGFSGNFSREVRFSKEARDNLDQIADMSYVDQDGEFLTSNDDKMSVTNKIHEWRDQSQLNINRFTDQLEQEFLEKFGGRKSRMARKIFAASGKLLNTESTELLQKAMNLYIDSGTGANRAKAETFAAKLAKEHKAGTITAKNSQKLDLVERMLNMSLEEKQWADSTIRPYYEDYLAFAQEHEILDSHVENYVKRIWSMPKHLKDAQISWTGTGTTGFKLTPSSGKQRSLDSIIDGWEAGLELKQNGVLSNLKSYANEIGYTFANRRFVDYMDSLVNPEGNGVMIELFENQKPPAGYTRLTDRGFAKPGGTMYARSDVAAIVNKLGERASHQMWDVPVVKFIRRMNATIKSTILSVSMYHHLAGMRSYVFGVKGKGLKLNPIKAYRRGLKKIDKQEGFADPNYKHMGPVVDFLVREGLTIGETQDWDEQVLMDSWIESALEDRTGVAADMALRGWQGARRWRRQMTAGLFGRLFAGLKAESAALEFAHGINKMTKKLGRGLTEGELKTEAQKIARLINADFGGLHLSRMGRNPDLQKAAQLLLLAPDWTESNWRTVTGMVPGLNKIIDKGIGGTAGPPGMSKVYRSFWRGIAMRGLLGVALANIGVLTLFGDDDDWQDWRAMIEEQLTWKNWSKGKWLSVNMAPVYRKLGMEDPDKRPLMSVMGHFKDILKLGDPRTLIKHKISPAGRIFETMWEGTDWKDAPFTTTQELIETGKLVSDNSFSKSDATWSTLPSMVMYNMRQSIPIFGSEFLQAIQGESAALSSLARAGGLEIRDTRRESVAKQTYDKVNSEINALDKALKDAQTVRDRKLVTEARRDIKDYDNFNRKKSRIGYTKSRLTYINSKIKPLELKAETDKGLSEREEAKLAKHKEDREKIYQQFQKVIER